MLNRVGLLRAGVLATLCAALLTACGGDSDSDVDESQVDAVEEPELGACRVLDPDDVAEASNATKTVECTEDHTAETFAVGPLNGFDDADYDDPDLSTHAYQVCSDAFEKFLGADESMVMRTVVSWAWFRPSEKAWDEGARWYRCDVIGGGEQSEEYFNLPTTAKGLLRDRNDDTWMVCADGANLAEAERVRCTKPHTWRAVTTIKVGKDTDPYPGDRMVEVKSRDFCSDSVGAWMNYPIDYDFAYTWFHEAEWEAGNRRSICWAKTEK